MGRCCSRVAATYTTPPPAHHTTQARLTLFIADGDAHVVSKIIQIDPSQRSNIGDLCLQTTSSVASPSVALPAVKQLTSTSGYNNTQCAAFNQLTARGWLAVSTLLALLHAATAHSHSQKELRRLKVDILENFILV